MTWKHPIFGGTCRGQSRRTGLHAKSPKASRPVRVRVKANGYEIVSRALEYAAERACNRSDKYNDAALTEGQRSVLQREFAESFWLSLADLGAEVK